MMKLHDWILENIVNQDFTPTDFKSIGLTTEDTQLLPMDSYLKSSYITDNDLFKDDNGEFSKEKFKKFYDERALGYLKFSTNYDTFLYDLFDTSRKIDSEVKRRTPLLFQTSNPMHSTTSVVGRNEQGLGPLSNRELAQISKVYDTETGEFLDYSVNLHALLSNPVEWLKDLFKDPIVYATFDEDGIHEDPITHREVKHKKGEFKMNPDGEYYVEKLGNRNIRGKLIVSALDYLTVDNKGINKYDFFDADGLDKSVSGVLASTTAAVAPLFAGPVVGGIYSGILVTREMAKALPMLSGMIDSAFGTNILDTRLINVLAAKGQSMTQSTSLYSLEKMFTMENIGKLIADVANQWGQLQLIAKGVRALGGGKTVVKEAQEKAFAEFLQKSQLPKYKAWEQVVNNGGDWTQTALGKATLAKYMPKAEKTFLRLNRLGADASLVYMAIVSNTDVYESMLNHGATKGEAALFALGSTIGMFGVDRYLGLGELFFDNLNNGLVRRMTAKNLDELVAPWVKRVKDAVSNAKSEGKNPVLALMNSAKEFGKKYGNKFADDIKYHSAGFTTKALGEGLEEVSEELVTDFTKTLYEQLGNFGITSTNDVGAWENAGARYAMSFLGGSLGGSIFYGVGLSQGLYPIHQLDLDILFHLRNGKLNDYLKAIDKKEANGEFGSRDLSWETTKIHNDETDTDENVFLTANSEAESLNHFIAERARQAVINLDAIINANLVNLTDEELFDKMVMADLKYKDMKDWLKDESYGTNYYLTYLNLLADIVKVNLDLLKAAKTKSGTADDTLLVDDEWRRNHKEDTPEGLLRIANLKKLEDRKAILEKQLENFLSGDTSLYYTRKMLFGLDFAISSRFYPVTFALWLKQTHNKEVDSLSQEDAKTYIEEYLEYQLNNRKNLLSEAFNNFLLTEPKVAPFISLLELDSKNFDTYAKYISDLFELNEDIYMLKSPLVRAESILPEIIEGDTKENADKWKALKKRYLEGQPLTPEEFAFFEERLTKVFEENKNRMQKILDVIRKAGNQLDPNTFRNLLIQVNSSKNYIEKSLKDEQKKQIGFGNLMMKSLLAIKELIDLLTPDNLDEILDNISEIIQKDRESRNKVISRLKDNIEDIIQDVAGDDAYDSLDIVDSGNISLLIEELERIKGDYSPDEELIARIDDYISLLEAIDENIPESEKEMTSLNSYTEANKIADKEIEDISNSIRSAIDNLIDKLLSNEELLFLNEIWNTADKENPFIKFLINISKNFGIDGIEDTVKEIFDASMKANSLEDFRLTPELLERISKVEDALDLVTAYLYAASSKGFNKEVNEYVKNHQKDITKIPDPLPEISDETFNTYIREASIYESVINLFNNIHANNAVNNRRKFMQGHKKFIEARQKVLNSLIDSSKFTIDDKEVDLLEGIDTSIPEGVSESTRLYLTEEIFHNNLLKLIKSGKSLPDIFEKSQILERLVLNEAGESTIVNQNTSIIDENIDYDKFTNYDRLNYILTLISLNTRDWNTFMLDEINGISDRVALDPQQYVAKIGAAAIQSDIFNAAYKYLANKGYMGKLNLLPNTTFISGTGGAGKTSTSARYLTDYLVSKLGYKEEDIWLSAPRSSLRVNLLSGATHGTIKESSDSVAGSELIAMATNPEVYNTIVEKLNNGEKNSEYYTVIEEPGQNSIVKLNWDKIPINKTGAPKVLIIDEYTHFNSVAQLILDRWADKVIGIGDYTLSGYFKGGLANIDKEFSFVLRTPKLGISLRLNNLLNYENLQMLSNLIDFLLNEDRNSPNYKTVVKTFQELVDTLALRVHNGKNINGTLLTSALSPDLIAKLPKKNDLSKKNVAFVGSKSSSNLKALKDAGIEVTDFQTIDSIQALEFDYVVSDIDINFLPGSDPLIVLNKLKDLYTLISRAKTGSILLGNIMAYNINDRFSATAPSIMEYFNDFKTINILELSEYLGTSLTPTKSKSTTEPSKETSEESATPTAETRKADAEIDSENDTSTPIESAAFFAAEDDPEIGYITTGSPFADIIYPGYTEITTLGARFAKKQGRGAKHYYWHPHDGKSPVKRDMEIFLRKEVREDEYKKRRNYERLLRSLISGILYNENYANLSLGSDANEYITPETFEKLKNNVFLELRDIDPERDIRLNVLYDTDKSGEPILDILGRPTTEKQLTIAIVAEADGLQVTLGYLASVPNVSSKESIDRLVASINKSIDRFLLYLTEHPDISEIEKKLINDEINKLAERAKTVGDEAIFYKNTITGLLDNYKSGERFAFDLPRNGFSSIYRIKGNTKPNLSDVRKNPDVVTSKVMIYSGGLPGVLKGAAGRPVVIQTGRIAASPTQMATDYEAQKTNISTVNPVEDTAPFYRMMMLSPRGLTIDYLRKNRVDAPISWSRVGIKTFVSAWNFRADLLNLQEAFKTFKTETGYSEDLITKVLAIMDLEARKVEVTETKPDNYDDIKNAIENFNKSLAYKVREFRLGGRLKEIEINGEKTLVGSLYIRKLDLPANSPGSSSNPFYAEPEKALGIYLTPDRMNLFIEILNRYFEAVSPLISPTTDDEDLRISEGDPRLKPTHFITSNRKFANNISHFISKNALSDTFTIEGVTLGDKADRYSSYLIATLKILDLALGVGTPGTSLSEAVMEETPYVGVKVKVDVTEENKEGQEITLDTKEIFKDTILDWNTADYTVMDLFRLIMHGTTEDIIDEKTNKPKGAYGEDGVMRATAAYYKDGIWPELKAGKMVEGTSHFFETSVDEKWLTLDAITRSPIIRITQKMLSNLKTVEQAEEERIKKESELEKARKIRAAELAPHYSSSEAADRIEMELEKSTDELPIYKLIIEENVSKIFSSREIDLNWYVALADNNPITLQQLLELAQGSSLASTTELEVYANEDKIEIHVGTSDIFTLTKVMSGDIEASYQTSMEVKEAEGNPIYELIAEMLKDLESDLNTIDGSLTEDNWEDINYYLNDLCNIDFLSYIEENSVKAIYNFVLESIKQDKTVAETMLNNFKEVFNGIGFATSLDVEKYTDLINKIFELKIC